MNLSHFKRHLNNQVHTPGYIILYLDEIGCMLKERSKITIKAKAISDVYLKCTKEMTSEQKAAGVSYVNELGALN